MEDEARLHWVRELAHAEAMALLPDHLRVVGEYARLVDRARRKRHALASNGLPNPAVADIGLTEVQLMHWYFEDYLGGPVSPDLGLYARSVGFADEDAFLRAVTREFYFATQTGEPALRSTGELRDNPDLVVAGPANAGALESARSTGRGAGEPR
jgi:hypothetical protein